MLYNRNTLIFNNSCFQRSVIFIIGVSVYTLSHSDVQKLIFADCSSVRGKALPAAATGALVAGRSNTRQHHAHSHMTALKTRLAQRKKEETRRREADWRNDAPGSDGCSLTRTSALEQTASLNNHYNTHVLAFAVLCLLLLVFSNVTFLWVLLDTPSAHSFWKKVMSKFSHGKNANINAVDVISTELNPSMTKQC